MRNVASMVPTYATRPASAAVPMSSCYGYQSMPSQMQLVPYNPTQVTQLYPQMPQVQQQSQQQDTKKPLTSEELQRLYSLNHAVVPRPNVVPGYVPATAAMSNFAPNYYGSAPYSMYNTGSNASFQSIYPASSTQSTGAAPKVRQTIT